MFHMVIYISRYQKKKIMNCSLNEKEKACLKKHNACFAAKKKQKQINKHGWALGSVLLPTSVASSDLSLKPTVQI